MYFAAIIVIMLYFLLFLLSGKEKLERLPSSVLKPFYRGAQFLYQRFALEKMVMTRQKQVVKELHRLYPADNIKQVCKNYYIDKIALSLLICFVGTLLGVLVSVKSGEEKLLQEDGTIVRGTYEENAREIDLEASFEDGRERFFSVQIGARRLTEQELAILWEEFSGQISEMILGENESLHEVSKDLRLEESYQGYPFEIEWHSSRPEIVAGTGTVYGVAEGAVDLVLTANIIYEQERNREWQYEISICVVPQVLSEKESFVQAMEEMLITNEQESRMEAVWKLPESFQGKAIQWKQVITDYGAILWAGALGTSVVVFFLADKDIHSSLEKKRAAMKRAYPDIVQKLVLYMGAGMTARGAFQRVAGNYEQGKKAEKLENAIYEEFCYACRELQSGISESVVYEHLGKRIGLQEYIRLSTLLMQNLKKGNSTLLQRLREEADRACIEQLQNSRRLGEEASTKLLLPMVLMLVVVMVLIMIPAFSSAQIM